MQVIKPRNRRAEHVDWKIAEHSREIVKYFAEYSEYTEEEIVEKCIVLLLDDVGFQDWIANRRFNTRIVEKLFPGDLRRKIEAKMEAKEKGA